MPRSRTNNYENYMCYKTNMTGIQIPVVMPQRTVFGINLKNSYTIYTIGHMSLKAFHSC